MDTKKIIEPAKRDKSQIVMAAFLVLLFGFGLWTCAGKYMASPSSGLAQYEVLREWKPDGKSDAWGAEILLQSKLDKVGMEKFLFDLGTRRKFVMVNVFTSRAAHKAVSDQAVDEGLICLYWKDDSTGKNEIKWMQKKGDFAELFCQYSILGRR